jgi:hypothetical protein
MRGNLAQTLNFAEISLKDLPRVAEAERASATLSLDDVVWPLTDQAVTVERPM